MPSPKTARCWAMNRTVSASNAGGPSSRAGVTRTRHSSSRTGVAPLPSSSANRSGAWRSWPVSATSAAVLSSDVPSSPASAAGSTAWGWRASSTSVTAAASTETPGGTTSGVVASNASATRSRPAPAYSTTPGFAANTARESPSDTPSRNASSVSVKVSAPSRRMRAATAVEKPGTIAGSDIAATSLRSYGLARSQSRKSMSARVSSRPAIAGPATPGASATARSRSAVSSSSSSASRACR